MVILSRAFHFHSPPQSQLHFATAIFLLGHNLRNRLFFRGASDAEIVRIHDFLLSSGTAWHHPTM